MNRSTLLSLGFVAGIAAVSSNAHAWLGGFEPNDGYKDFYNPTQGYNAGHYGPNSGYGGAYAVITPNTDFWKAVYGGAPNANGYSYCTGHFGTDRLYVNNGLGSSANLGLQLTTCQDGWANPALEYTYTIDAPDLGGVSPASTGGSIVDMSYWYRGALNGADSFGGVAEGYFGDAVEVRDSASNVGFKIGITQRATGDKLTYWNGSSLFESTIAAPEWKYDRIDLTVDVANDTFSLNYFQFSTSTLFPLVLNQPLMAAMNDFSQLDLRTSPGTGNDKHFGMNLDDFSFKVAVPEPSSIGAITVAAAALLMRRRRRA